MPKIFILLACEECHHCLGYHYIGPGDWRYIYKCLQSEKEIPDIGEIAEFCELDDAEGKDE